jgi:hypothetical protein
MGTQDALTFGDWPFDDFFVSSVLADMHETQPGAPMDLSDSGGAVTNSTEANNAGSEISATLIGTHYVNDTPPNGSRHPSGSFFSQAPPQRYGLFSSGEGIPFHEAHPDNKGPFASDGPLHDTLSMNICGTNAE